MFKKLKPLRAPVPFAHLLAVFVFLSEALESGLYWSATGMVLFGVVLALVFLEWEGRWEDDVTVAGLAAMAALALLHETGWRYSHFIVSSIFVCALMLVVAVNRVLVARRNAQDE